MSNISINITGDKEISTALNQLSKEFKDYTEPLDNSSKKFMSAISQNFSDEGKTFGKPWAPLSPVTIAIKRKLRAEGKSIGVEKPLLRTGLMRKSFGYNIREKTNAQIYNNTDYAMVHQEGGTVFYKGRRLKVPRRILADIDSKREQSILMTFERWINDTIRRRGME